MKNAENLVISKGCLNSAHARSREFGVNDAGTGGKSDTPLTHACSRPDPPDGASHPDRDPNGYALVLRPGFLGLYTATVEYVGAPWSPTILLFSPSSAPPKAPATSAGGPNNVEPWAEARSS